MTAFHNQQMGYSLPSDASRMHFLYTMIIKVISFEKIRDSIHSSKTAMEMPNQNHGVFLIGTPALGINILTGQKKKEVKIEQNLQLYP